MDEKDRESKGKDKRVEVERKWKRETEGRKREWKG